MAARSRIWCTPSSCCVSPDDDARRYLRMLAKLAERAEREAFLDECLGAGNETHLNQALLHDEQSVTVRIQPGDRAAELNGRTLREASLPAGILVSLVRRGARVFEAEPSTRLQRGDSLTLLGEPEALEAARERLEDGGTGNPSPAPHPRPEILRARRPQNPEDLPYSAPEAAYVHSR